MLSVSDDINGHFERLPFRMHPRVFAALGADLVTNDIVAVIELVKNSYDALAQNVWLRFHDKSPNGPFLEIEDDGEGMTKEAIKNGWCLVATPYKEFKPIARNSKTKRLVSGSKGLGRLSAARLGDQLQIVTQTFRSTCYELIVNWNDLTQGTDISESFANCREYPDRSPFKRSGTILRIYELHGLWDESRISDLEDNLARLLSPFSASNDFSIYLSGFGESQKPIRIESPVFLSKPKYCIKGNVDSSGNVIGIYRYSPLSSDDFREKAITYPWERIYDDILNRENPARFRYSPTMAHCGPFSFELRAWDISSDDTQEIAERFDFQKNQVRKAIRTYKGISVYRDDVLVLPKSETARDWLGLDLRRVSRVGLRLSTSQLVGYVSISKEKNPAISDTSDRERLALNLEVAEFEEILKAIVALLENEREQDRFKPETIKPMDELFRDLSSQELLNEVIALSEEGAHASEAVPLLRAFTVSLESARKNIQERFIYYSRMATIGTIAQMLVHEIRNRTTAFGSFLEFFKDRFGPFRDKELEAEYRCADDSVTALEHLADTFSPLANRGFKRRQRQSILEKQIHECLAIHSREIERKQVRYYVPSSETSIAVDPGELDAIILNLVANSLYWLGDVPKTAREIHFQIRPEDGNKRVRISVHDSGPGINSEDVEKVFLPGVTRKPGGIGMGLTVASELVAAYDGRMSLIYPGIKGGASFSFDLPLTK